MLHFQEVDLKIRKEVDAAVKLAREDPDPPLDDLAMHVYANGTNGIPVRGCDLMTELPSN